MPKTKHSWGAWMAFQCISLMHDNRLLSVFKDPERILKQAGLSMGDKVLEVGCGPGFYTLAAARMVGEKGRVFALDVNPYAIQKVREKAKKTGLNNIVPVCQNAACSHLPGQSLDLAFVFGLPKIAGGRGPLIKELARIIKPGGAVVYQQMRKKNPALTAEMDRAGFCPEGRNQTLVAFRRR